MHGFHGNFSVNSVNKPMIEDEKGTKPESQGNEAEPSCEEHKLNVKMQKCLAHVW